MVKIEQVDTFSGNLTTMTDTKLAIQSIPSLHAFDQRCTTWESYRDRLSFYFKANHLKDDGDMKSLFLWSVGETTYSLLESLVAPVKLTNDELTYEELIKQLDKHFDSTRNIMTASFDFYSCYQKPGQTFQQWKAELCNKLKHCGFTSSKLATKPQDRALRDMYVIGLRSAKIRQALLKVDDPTLEEAEKIIQAAERIQADMKHFDSPLKSNDLGIARVFQEKKSKQNQREQQNSMNKNDSTPKSESKSCDCCGATNHRRNECKFREFTCHNCKQKGHLARVCKQSEEENQVNFVSTVYSVHRIGAISGTLNQTPCTSLSINGFDLSLAIDTGAIDTIVDTITWHKIGSPELFEEKTRLKCYSGSMLDVQGECLVQVKYNSTIHTLPVIVVNGPRQGLLGIKWIVELKLDLNELIYGTISSTNSVKMVSTENDIQEFRMKPISNEKIDAFSQTKFSVGQLVWMFRAVRNKRSQWEPATIVRDIDSMVYTVKTSNGQQFKRHQNQLRVRFCSKTINEDDYLLNKSNDQQVHQAIQQKQVKRVKKKKPDKVIKTIRFKRYSRQERQRPNRF